jgi:hypothetical protein
VARKIFRFGFTPNQQHLARIPPRAEGRIAIVTDVEAGSGGREWSQHCPLGMPTNDRFADGQAVWS